MNLEQKINALLMSHPKMKKVIKRMYQGINVFIKKPSKFEGQINCVSPKDCHDYFFGYYDKSPWDVTNRYMLCMKAEDTSNNVAPQKKLDILLIDTKENNRVQKIAESRSWNVQQGCMAQWLGPNYDEKIIYNDFRNNKFCSIILNVRTKEEKIIDFPIYSVSSDGKFALSLDFARLHRLRPGYGYSNIQDTTCQENVPSSPCIWYVDLEKNMVKPFLKYEDLYNFEHRIEMENSDHKINHIMISPNNDKFMFIHRWLNGNKKFSRLITCEIKNKCLYNLSDDNMVSHCYWKNNNEIIGYMNKNNTGAAYYVLMDKSKKYYKYSDYLKIDGHPSYNPNSDLVLTDTYPNNKRISTIRIMNQNTSSIIAKVYNPFKYDNDTRCDLHPRWSRDFKKICFDGCFEGKRRLYTIELNKLNLTSSKIIGTKLPSIGKYKILFIINTCRNSGPTQVVFNIIKKLDTSLFEPIIMTLNEEKSDSNIGDIYPFVSKHYYLELNKKDIILGKLKKIKKAIEEINPDVIHTTGVFPDYAIAKLKTNRQMVTMHNYVYDDYCSKFGKIKGLILAQMQLFAAKKSSKTVTCSKSLRDIYKEKLNLSFDYIQNGIDINIFKKTNDNKNDKNIRKELNISDDVFVLVYTGQFVTRKNISITLDAFNLLYKNNKNYCYILCGDGPELSRLKEQQKETSNIIFTGNVNNVHEYLNISNAYISASKSEGLPNGVLEALASGLPVILSNIPQHMEILNYCEDVGYSFQYNNLDEITTCMKKITESKDLNKKSLKARSLIKENFSSEIMSKKYQKYYLQLIEKRCQ